MTSEVDPPPVVFTTVFVAQSCAVTEQCHSPATIVASLYVMDAGFAGWEVQYSNICLHNALHVESATQATAHQRNPTLQILHSPCKAPRSMLQPT